MWKYVPDIIICSWLPSHPNDFFTQKYLLKYEQILLNSRDRDLTSAELSFFHSYDDKRDGPDVTSYRRKQLPELKEYILIGKTSDT